MPPCLPSTRRLPAFLLTPATPLPRLAIAIAFALVTPSVFAQTQASPEGSAPTALDKVVVTVDQHGNSSAASIPLALDLAVRAGQVR